MRLSFLALAAAVVTAASVASADDKVDYNRDIRPILSDKCYKCHGPDEGQREAGLRLDVRKIAVSELESGSVAIVPGKTDQSELYARITSDDEFVRMPPADSKKQLSAKEIELLKQWIEQGAEFRDHWSFIPPQRPALPQIKHTDGAQNAIDYFIRARLEKEGLQPAPPADKETLIRRVTLDLTGLPPTLKEIDAFLADKSPRAYEKLVDRLLASPRYGEHMARYWLDYARYGDTHGLHLDNVRSMWPYRDWVIRAFNTNKPFDAFTVEQLAGDLLPNPTLAQQVATGFNRCNVTTSEGGSIAEEFRVRYAVDRVETLGTVWLGLTVGCAVCHEHKFDPISQKEFYQFFAYYNSTADKAMDGNALLPPPYVRVATPEQRQQLAALKDQLNQLKQSAQAKKKEGLKALDAWVAQLGSGEETLPEPPADMVLHYPLDEQEGNKVNNACNAAAHGTIQGQASWQEGKLGGALSFDGNTHVELGEAADFERSDKFSYGAWVKVAGPEHMAVLARMDDGNNYRGWDLYIADGRVYVHLIHGWPGNAIRVNTKKPIKLKAWQHVMMTYDGSSKAAGVNIYVNGQSQEIDVTHNKLAGSIKTDKPLRIGRRNPGAPMKGLIDDVRVFNRQLGSEEVALLAGADPIREIVALPPEKRSKQQKQLLENYYLRKFHPEVEKLNQQAAEVQGKVNALEKSFPGTLVMQEMAKPRDAFVLIRGEYDRRGEKVSPGVPAAFPELPEGAPNNRLGLAKWLVSGEHPLTARVTVNRYWQRYFGTGIVKTSEDFGSQGEWPSHPDLLDWLAVEFVESGWDIKHLQKLIVMSGAYRQTAEVDPGLYKRDPENRLLARGPRFRMDAEIVRDSALFISGLLVEKIGGPSVKPYQPDGLWKAVGYSGSNTVRFQRDAGDKLFRRSMYTFWKRTAPPPSMQIFDAPSREVCTVRRERTNTPAAALCLLNDVQFVEAARHFAERMLTEGGDLAEDKLTYGFRLATGREPQADELKELSSLLKELLAEYQSNEKAAQELLKTGETPRNEKLPAAVHAAWTMIGNVLLNLDETITKG